MKKFTRPDMKQLIERAERVVEKIKRENPQLAAAQQANVPPAATKR